MIATTATLVRKVERLIALTTSDRIEEARTSALIACRLIRQHGLHVVTDPPALAASAATRSPDHETPRPLEINSRYDSACLDCRGRIHSGDRCIWLRGRSVWHVECAPW